MDTKIIQSSSHDPWYNLSIEEYLFNNVKDNEVILYLWQNKNTVVIGRNQNPWKECRYKQLEDEGGKLARRLSGGGTVYHDLGNLNFTFIMHEKLYDLQNQLKVILEGVKKLGVDARFSGRNDIVYKDKKFSGNAFYFDNGRSYHHGTMLINVDFSKLSRYLQVSKEKIISKGINSVQSRVINLSDINKTITIDKAAAELKSSFNKIYGMSSEYYIDVNLDNDEFKKLYEKYSSWEWRYGETPEFDVIFDRRFSWGGIELGLQLNNGYITEAKVYSDAMDPHFINNISIELKGKLFDKRTILKVIDNIHCKELNIVNDLKNWIDTLQI
nr:lipoate--protein ligase [Clostridium sp. JN-1]